MNSVDLLLSTRAKPTSKALWTAYKVPTAWPIKKRQVSKTCVVSVAEGGNDLTLCGLHEAHFFP